MILNQVSPEVLIEIPWVTAILTIAPSAPVQDTLYTIPSGYDGWTKATVSGDANLIASNVRQGVTIFGVRGSYT